MFKKSWIGLTTVLVMIGGAQGASADGQDMSVAGRGSQTPAYGWACHSRTENRPVYVDVFQMARSGVYSMKIQRAGATESDPFENLGYFRGVKPDANEDKIRFEASDAAQGSAELVIDQREGGESDLDSTLRLKSSAFLLVQSEEPAETLVRLACSPTR